MSEYDFQEELRKAEIKWRADEEWQRHLDRKAMMLKEEIEFYFMPEKIIEKIYKFDDFFVPNKEKNVENEYRKKPKGVF